MTHKTFENHWSKQMGGCKNSNLLTCLKTLPTGCTGRNLDIRTHVTCAVPMYGGRGPKSCNSAKSAKSRLVDLAVPSENETPQKTEVQASSFCGISSGIDQDMTRY